MKILNERILNILERNTKVHDRQYGFRVGKGTEDAIVAVSNSVKGTNKVCSRCNPNDLF